MGLDKTASDLNRLPRFASSMQNAQYRTSGAPEKRRGYQIHSSPVESFGMFTYNRINDQDVLEQLVIAPGRNVERLFFTTLNVEYTGSDVSATLSFFFDPDSAQYRCQINVGTSQVLDFPVGVGYDEAIPITIDDLADEINLIADFTATVDGNELVPAAFLKIVRDIDLKTMEWNGIAGYWEQVNQAITNPFDGSYTNKGETFFENISAVVMRNVLYLSNGYDYVQKYDGQTLYRAGLPTPATLTSALGAAGAVTGNNYVHRARYIQVDAVGNIIEGNILPVSTPINATADKMNVTVANILAASGFNTNAGIVVGDQTGVTTISLDNGSGGAQTLNVGDTAYFYDHASGGYVERLVLAADPVSIEIDGAMVDVLDNEVISNNLRIQIQRNATSAITPDVFYEVVEIPNNPFTATQVYVDNTVDGSLGFLISPPATDRSPPPKGKYLTSYQNLLFIAGNPSAQSKLYWSDIDGPEYFPNGINEDRIDELNGDPLTGIGGGTSVLGVWTKNATVIGSGTFADINYRLEIKASNIGCDSHASIVLAEGYITWWSSRGPYAMAGGQMPQALGANKNGESRIATVMDQFGYESNAALEPLLFRSKRCLAFNWKSEGKILFYLPAEDAQSDDRIPNTNSRIFCYDYKKDAWLEWTTLNMMSGICSFGDEVYFKTRRISGLTSDTVSELCRFHNLNDAWDYEDNDQPIEWEYGPQWEDLGQPDVLKKFLELEVFSLENVSNSDFSITVRQEINFQYAGVAEFEMTLEGLGYGQTAYGSGPYGDPASPKLKHDLAKARTFSTRPVFTNSEDQKNCIISGWSMLFVAPFRVEFKK